MDRDGFPGVPWIITFLASEVYLPLGMYVCTCTYVRCKLTQNLLVWTCTSKDHLNVADPEGPMELFGGQASYIRVLSFMSSEAKQIFASSSPGLGDAIGQSAAWITSLRDTRGWQFPLLVCPPLALRGLGSQRHIPRTLAH